MNSVVDILTALNDYPIAIVVAILIAAIAARIVHRFALYALMLILVIVFGASWAAAFVQWIE